VKVCFLDPSAQVKYLVTGDQQLAGAAQAEGLAVANPFDFAHLDTATP